MDVALRLALPAPHEYPSAVAADTAAFLDSFTALLRHDIAKALQSANFSTFLEISVDAAGAFSSATYWTSFAYLE